MRDPDLQRLWTWDIGHNSRDGFMTINMNLDSLMSFEKLGVVVVVGALGL